MPTLTIEDKYFLNQVALPIKKDTLKEIWDIASNTDEPYTKSFVQDIYNKVRALSNEEYSTLYSEIKNTVNDIL